VSLKVHQSLQALGVADDAGVEALAAELRSALDAELSAANTPEDVEQLRIRWVGRKQGLLGAANDNWLKSAPGPLKRTVGRLLNELKARAASGLQERRQAAEELAARARLAEDRIDVTLPGVRKEIGARHPIQMVIEDLEEIFLSMGYTVEVGPEIETDYYNFEALNFPPGHPSRDTQDTLFVTADRQYMLRTHTSPVQIRTMEKYKPPLRAVTFGKVYRRDQPDASHSFMFHQMEGFAVGEDITLCDLKGTLEHFTRRLYGEQVRTRFRPSFFPFTEPSLELDMSCIFCRGSGCAPCKYTGWMELLGSGMIDPNLYGFVGYDASKVSGFAFGTGIDRLAMLRYGVNDIQLLFRGDMRMLRQFQ
jgi:phenylalanyl-tRNA synthetase alpha chain